MRNEELARIFTEIHETSGLTPEAVVEVARAATHPLHSQFEWDDSVAAESYRRSQASDLIRKVKIRYAEDDQGRDKDVRAFVSVRPPDSPHEPIYRPTGDVLADPFQRQLLLRECRREWLAFRRKYDYLVEFAEIVSPTEEAG